MCLCVSGAMTTIISTVISIIISIFMREGEEENEDRAMASEAKLCFLVIAQKICVSVSTSE